jgi:NADH dehydrogenase [ubiquinone] 1 alpha subcomplex assembly factor 5
LIQVDTEDIKVGYPDMVALMNDLRLMGESNCIIGRKPFLRRDVIARAGQIYKGTEL